MSDYTLTLNHRDLPTQVLFHRFHTFDNYADNLAWLLLSGSLYQPDPGFFRTNIVKPGNIRLDAQNKLPEYLELRKMILPRDR